MLALPCSRELKGSITFCAVNPESERGAFTRRFLDMTCRCVVIDVLDELLCGCSSVFNIIKL